MIMPLKILLAGGLGLGVSWVFSYVTARIWPYSPRLPVIFPGAPWPVDLLELLLWVCSGAAVLVGAVWALVAS